MPILRSRRQFLTTLSLASTAGLFRCPPAPAAEGGLETTTVRIANVPGICIAPQYVAEDLLRAEGFTDVRYVEVPVNTEGPSMGRGEADFSMSFVADFIQDIDAGAPIVLVAGVHVGCFELFARQDIHRYRRAQGQAGRSGRPRVAYADGWPSRSRPGQRFPLGHRPLGQSAGTLRAREDRRLLGLPAASPGAACAACWTRAR